jgi:FtsZ-binding cell division protein ZapB
MKTDFSTWKRQTLEDFAKEAAETNRLLDEEIEQLKEDRKLLLERIRQMTIESAKL